MEIRVVSTDDDQPRIQYKLIHALTTNGSVDEIKQILEKLEDINALYPDISWMDKFSGEPRTRPLFKATGALSGWKESLVKLLLDYGADVNLHNETGETALHGAVKKGNKYAVRELLSRGADINAKITPMLPLDGLEIRDGDMLPGWTALHEAAYQGSEMMVRLLIDQGASISERDIIGRTALDIAMAQKNQGPFWALVEHGANYSEKSNQTGNASSNQGTTKYELPDWVYTSASSMRHFEPLVSNLEDLILSSSELKDFDNTVRFCAPCCKLKEEKPLQFQQKMQNISNWLKDANFDTPFMKRCLLCRRVTASLESNAKIEYVQEPKDNAQEVDTLERKMSSLSLQWNNDEFPMSEPIDLIYEASSTYSPNRWPITITEEMSYLLDHIEDDQDDRTDSKSAYTMAAYWLHSCLTKHPKCSPIKEIPTLPTRVIDVGSESGDSNVCLFTSKGTRGLYTALSYRWNGVKTFTTTKCKLDELKESIPFNELPKQIQDAITATRNLGIRYIWVDAVCIVQDDEADWIAEAAKMPTVYSNAVLTLAAGDAPEDNKGMFRKRDHFPRPCRKKLDPDGMSGYFDYCHPHFKFASTSRSRPPGELDTRGWCLQEQLLSPRILIYEEGELFWDCMTLNASESFPGGISGAIHQNKTKILTDMDTRYFKNILIQNDQDHQISNGGKEAYKLWRTAVEEYTNRQLTFEKDYLVAIKGISDILGAYVEDELIAGIWKKSFAQHILWWVDSIFHEGRYTIRAKSAITPTWSWASVVGNVSYRPIGLYRSPDDDIHDLGTAGNPFQSLFSVVKIDTAFKKRDGIILPRITLSGSIIKVFSRDSESGKCVYYSGWRHLHYHGRRIFLSPGVAPPVGSLEDASDNKDDSKKDIFDDVPKEYANWIAQRRILPERQTDCWEPWFPDTEDDYPAEMFCFLVGIENNNQYCLCLVKTGDADEEYRRIGVCNWYIGHADIGSNGLGTSATIHII